MVLQLGLLLLLLSWIQPLHTSPWPGWHSEVLSFAALGLLLAQGLWSVWRSKGAKAVLPFPNLAWILSGMLLLVVVQTYAGQIAFTGDALTLGLYLLLSTGALALGAASMSAGREHTTGVDQWDALLMLASVMLLGALLSSVAALVQLTDVWHGVDWINRVAMQRRPGGNLGQPNQLATLLLMGVVSLVYLWEKGKLGRYSALLMFVLLATGVTVSESRAGQLSLAILVLWWFAARKRAGFKLNPAVVLAGAGLSLAAFWLWPYLPQLWDSGEVSSARTMLSGGGRVVVWPQLWEAVQLHPWVGWGLRGVPAAHNAVAHAYAVSEPYGYSHNIVLDMALGMGLPLTILLVLVAVRGLWRRISAVQSLDAWFCLAAVVPVLVHSMLEFPYAYAYFLAPVMFLLGRLDAEVKCLPVWQIRHSVASMVFALACAVGAASVVEYVAVEEDFVVARFEALHVGKTPEAHARPEIRLLTQLDALLEGTRIAPRPGMDSAELALVRNLALRYPWPANQNRYALALALNGQPEEAKRQLLVMRAQTHYNKRLYASVRDKWQEMAATQYPQLKAVELP